MHNRRAGNLHAGIVADRADLDVKHLKQVAQRGQVALGDVLPDAQGGRVAGVDPLRRQGEERFAPVGLEGGIAASQWSAAPDPPSALAGRPLQVPGRRQSEAHVDCGLYRPNGEQTFEADQVAGVPRVQRQAVRHGGSGDEQIGEAAATDPPSGHE